MNPWQMAQQLKHELQQITWPGGSQEVVFGSSGVHVFAGAPTEEQIPPAFPWALVGIGTSTLDEETPELLEQEFTLVIGAEVAGDPLGEQGIIGGSVAELGSSAGRGVAEVSERARAATQRLTGADGAPILVSASAMGAPEALGNGRHLVLEEVRLTAICTSPPHFAAPQKVKLTGGTPGITWTGSHCSARFDFVSYIVVEKAGHIPSSSPSDGTTVSPANLTDPYMALTPKKDYVYTVFGAYNARQQAGVSANFSSTEVGSYVVKT